MDQCIECNRVVTGRQQALECDHCREWQHHICGTGISQQEYREAVRSREGFDWICGPCLVYINEDSQEEDNTNIDQLGEYVVHPLIVELEVFREEQSVRRVRARSRSNTDRLQLMWHEHTEGQRNAISLVPAASNIMP